MEIAAAVLGITDAAVRTSSKLWELSSAWRDAPSDLRSLRDDLAHTERFFMEIQEHLEDVRVWGSPKEPGGNVGTDNPQCELDRLISKGSIVLRRIEDMVDGLSVQDGTTNTQTSDQKIEELGKRRKFLWLRQTRRVAKSRKDLERIRASICQFLISHNV